MTGASSLLVLAIMTPATGVVLAMACGARAASRIALAVCLAGGLIAVGIAGALWQSGRPLVYTVGGWAPPLGIELRADGLAAIMLLTSAGVIGALALYARATYAPRAGAPEARGPLTFWIMVMGTWSGLGTVCLAGDLFTLYVALELLTFSAVPLVSLEGKPETLIAALRYMLFALIGSIMYLLGCALLYGAHGTLDIALLARAAGPGSATIVAAALMIAGLAAKTALFPLYLWLPPAHAGAPAAGSALLSALVVKGSFILAVRLWFDALPGVGGPAAASVLGAMGAAAILGGSILALRQTRLKLMIAYSTVAQIGYLFFLFPLAAAVDDWSRVAWTGGMMQLMSHAVAKAAMFLSAGLIAEALGHDRIAGFAGLGRSLPMVLFAFGLAGMSLMGLPPSGGFVAKAMLLTAAVGSGQWWWAVVILIGGLLAAGYVFRVLSPALTGAAPAVLVAPVARSRQAIVLGMAVAALLLGLVPLRPSHLLEIGRPAAAVVGQ